MVDDSIFIQVPEKINGDELFKELCQHVRKFVTGKNISAFITQSPLNANSSESEYEYKLGFVILIPGYKLIFSSINGNDSDGFKDYYEDFLEDLSSLSDKYKHKEIIGRTRKWSELLTNVNLSELLESDFSEFQLRGTNKTRGELLISLTTGSINDVGNIGVEKPKNMLEAIKKRIVLFDADQTRFIYDANQKYPLTIQGLAGTGKTELLLHKLHDLYTDPKHQEDKIVFTCFNKVLANEMLTRIPNFFDFMKVEKQIEWNTRL